MFRVGWNLLRHSIAGNPATLALATAMRHGIPAWSKALVESAAG
jgi:hypothetical protein